MIKPFLDFIVAAIALLFLAPLFLCIMLLLAVVLKGNPFFTQIRPGKKEKLFTIIKFRTMSNERDSSGELLPDHERLSGFGKLVRSTSLDELPQLLNVVLGHMSFVGPRPLLPSYLPLYNDQQRKRHYVKPGITGWAQVNGRNAITWENKFTLDVFYVENVNIFLDMKIMAKTLMKVVKRADIRGEESVTVEPFKGNES